MADWTPSSRWAVSGAGSLIIPDYWVPALEEALPLYSVWSQFLGQTYGDAEVAGPGLGLHFKVSVLGDLSMSGTNGLTEGTKVAAESSTGLSQVVGTLKEYGKAEVIANFSAWMSNVSMQQSAAINMAKNAAKTRDVLIGQTFVATSNYFTCNGTGTASKGTYTGTQGTNPIAPEHVKQIASELRRLGVAPFDDGFYRWVGAPGMFDYLKGQSEVYQSAAMLGKSEIYSYGQVLVYGGFVFIEELGPNTATTYSATVGTTCVFGKDAVYGYDNFLRPDLIKYYADDDNDFGRVGKMGWYAVAGYIRPVDASTNSRCWLVYSKGGM